MGRLLIQLNNYFKNDIYIQLATRNLKRHSSRTVLAAIGIIIGVIAISSMGILGNSLKLSVTDSLGDVGNELVIYPQFEIGNEGISQKQVSQIEKISGIDQTITLYSQSSEIKYKDLKLFSNIYGIDADKIPYLVEFQNGRVYNNAAFDCVIGNKIAEELKVNVGGKITLENNKFRVIGILKERGMGFDISADNGVFISQNTFSRIYDTEKGYNNVIVQVKDINSIETVQKDIEDRLNKKDKSVMVLATNSLLDSINQISRYISLFLMGISSVSLIVAGVSILNVMLMSTMERTKEIGVLKAVGASKKDILKIFLLEAIMLGIIASIIGGILTFSLAFIIAVLIFKQPSYLFSFSSILYIFIGMGFGILTATIGGGYPAMKASKMKPLDALRHE